MLRNLVASLTLCCLPVMADSITFNGGSNWANFGQVSATGTDSLTYAISDNSVGVEIASVGTNVSILQNSSAYDISGTLYAWQGFGYLPARDYPQTGASLVIELNLPATSGDWLVAGTDTESDTDGYGTGYSSCWMGIMGGTSSGSCNSSAFSNTVSHAPGDPLTLDLHFGNGVFTFNSAYEEQFHVTLADPEPGTAATPEPATLLLVMGSLLAGATLRRRLA